MLLPTMVLPDAHPRPLRVILQFLSVCTLVRSDPCLDTWIGSCYRRPESIQSERLLVHEAILIPNDRANLKITRPGINSVVSMISGLPVHGCVHSLLT